MVHRLKGEVSTHTVWLDGEKLALIPSLKLVNHSPTGFNWGYCGSGPAQLALAVCLKLFGKDRALAVYDEFKWNVISELHQASDFDIKFDEDTLALLGDTAEIPE